MADLDETPPFLHDVEGPTLAPDGDPEDGVRAPPLAADDDFGGQAPRQFVAPPVPDAARPRRGRSAGRRASWNLHPSDTRVFPRRHVSLADVGQGSAAERGARMLRIEGLVKRFGRATAVDGVSISVERPTMIGVIGRSGAGKSTLLRAINLLERPTEGRVVFEGREVTALRGARARAWQADCAMIFQQFNLVPRMDVVSNVLHGTLNRAGTLRALFALWPREDVHRAIDILHRLGIHEHAAKRAEVLSGGQQQRVAIARALMQDPAIILADEPIASLDPMNAQIVMDALRAIHEEDGRTVLCNLHTLDTARRFCDRVIGMRDGRVVFDGPPDALTTDAAREIYGAGAGFSEGTTSTSVPDAAREAPAPVREAEAAV